MTPKILTYADSQMRQAKKRLLHTNLFTTKNLSASVRSYLFYVVFYVVISMFGIQQLQPGRIKIKPAPNFTLRFTYLNSQIIVSYLFKCYVGLVKTWSSFMIPFDHFLKLQQKNSQGFSIFLVSKHCGNRMISWIYRHLQRHI